MLDFLQGKWIGHPLHPAIVHVPMALWPAALAFDLLSRSGIGGNAMVQISFYSILLGLLAALISIPFGLADWWGIGKDKPAWYLGVYHMVINLVAAALWAFNLGLRVASVNTAQSVAQFPFIMSMIGTLVVVLGAYLGGRMVFGFGTSVARISKAMWRQIAEEGGAKLPEK